MDKLYHYCSSDTFANIIQSRKVRLSAMSLSNDSMEGQLVRRTLLEKAERDGLDRSDISKIERDMRFFDEFTDGLALCLSREGDLLSQWRGYADDAKGVAIGFSKDYLKKLAEMSKEQEIRGGNATRFALREVKYDHAGHIATIEKAYEKLRPLIEEGAYKVPRQNTILSPQKTEEELLEEVAILKNKKNSVLAYFLSLVPDLYTLKSEAFIEEREERLLALHIYDSTYDSESSTKYRGAGNRIIPFQEVELLEIDGVDAVLDVKLGPKHITPIHVIESILALAGFKNFEVTRSAASYR